MNNQNVEHIKDIVINVMNEIEQKNAKISEFESALTILINRYSMENNSNTPDFILANYLMSCLRNFEDVLNSRNKWYGFGVDISNAKKIRVCLED